MKIEAAPINPSQYQWLQSLRPAEEISSAPSQKKPIASILGTSGSLVLHAVMFSGLALYSTKFIAVDKNAEPLEVLLFQPVEPEPIKQSITPPAPAPIPAPTAAPTPAPTVPPEIKVPSPKPVEQPKAQVPEPPPAPTAAPVQAPVPVTPVAPPTPARPPVITKPAVDARYAQSNPKPQYPTMARRLGHEGTVTLEITVSREGTAREVKVAESSGYSSLDEAAAQAISKWQFVPATVNGEPVEQTLLTRWTYKLN